MNKLLTVWLLDNIKYIRLLVQKQNHRENWSPLETFNSHGKNTINKKYWRTPVQK